MDAVGDTPAMPLAQAAHGTSHIAPVLGRLGLASACGIAWGCQTATLAFVPLVFVAWWRARTRLEALCVVAAYHIVAARSLIVGGARFYEVSVAQSLVVVALGALVAASPWAAMWCAPSRRIGWLESSARLSAIFCMSILPPLTAFAVPSVWAAAGAWFPGCGIAGLLGLIGVALGMRPAPEDGGRWSATTELVPHALLCCLLYARFERRQQPPALPDASALQTHFDASPSDALDFLRQWQVAHDTMVASHGQTGSLLVLPESVGGLWQPAMEREWAPFSLELQRRGQNVLVGVTLPRPDGGFRAGAVLLGAERGRYVQRAPIPFAMWRPWSDDTHKFEASWLGRGTLRVRGRDLGLFVCWEIGVLWTVLQSVARGADALVVVANTAWARGTSAAQAELQMTEAWGALFELPTLVAMNR